jgi:hypothetical protein
VGSPGGYSPFALLADEATCEDAVSELEKVAQVTGAKLNVLTDAMSNDPEGSLMPALKGAFQRLYG